MSLMKPRKRNLLLAGEMRDEGDPEIDVTEDEAETEIIEPMPEPIPEPTPVPIPSAPASFAMTAKDLQAMITAAVTAAASGNAALADAVTQGIANSREPIPENKIDPGISVFNPLGDQKHPRPVLKCPVYLGTQDAKTKQVHDTYPMEDGDLTVQEVIALNILEPVHAVVERLDGVKMKVSIVPEYDAVTDALTKLTIVVPGDVIAKGSQVKNMLPGIPSLVKQITGYDYSKLAGEELAWFMAEHRAKRYVSVRDTVAA